MVCELVGKNVKELTCIVCPVGCSLTVDEGTADNLIGITRRDPGGSRFPSELTVSGNRCPRGAAYALEETYNPRRMVTATCAVSGADGAERAYRRVPVRTSIPCPREKIPALLADIYITKALLPIKAGDVLIADWKGSGIDIVATRSLPD